jgi:hypothetical protein
MIEPLVFMLLVSFSMVVVMWWEQRRKVRENINHLQLAHTKEVEILRKQLDRLLYESSDPEPIQPVPQAVSKAVCSVPVTISDDFVLCIDFDAETPYEYLTQADVDWFRAQGWVPFHYRINACGAKGHCETCHRCSELVF